MATVTRTPGAVDPTPGAALRLRPLPAGAARITGGFWADRLRLNREQSIPYGFEQLDRAGNLHDLRLAAGMPGTYRALGIMFGTPFPFLDSDVYKWLEAAGWEQGREASPEIARMGDTAIDLVAKAQRPDGYLNSFVQVLAPGQEYKDLRWGHELYCYGHLIQAAVAWHRALGDDRLLEIASAAAGSLERELGPGAREAIDGHPGVEMALVELYRATAERRHLETAAAFIDRRGHGLLGSDRFGAAYWQDHAPVRDATEVTGHAVRQLYLDAGAVDVAVELGDAALLEAVRRRWMDMVATRTYLTGALGSRHRDEAFGDPFELPPDQAYAESCAAIASVMLGWRLLLATGEPAAADLVERTMVNGVLSACGLDGTSFFYVNPLQRRTHRAAADPHDGERQAWYPCSCCPPNLMRILSTWEQQLATTDEAGIQLHQYASAEIRADVAGGEVRLTVETGYPWDGRVGVEVRSAPETPWTLTLRRPAWADVARIEWPDGRDADGAWSRTATWRAGDRVVLDLDMRARVVEPNRRIDAVRGSVAIERGPMVQALETADLPPGVDLEDVVLDASPAPADAPRPDVGVGIVGTEVAAVVRPAPSEAWPYAPADDDGDDAARRIALRTIPYFAWANRGAGAMRVWIPRAGGGAGDEGHRPG
jgi:DUF1680 family protein